MIREDQVVPALPVVVDEEDPTRHALDVPRLARIGVGVRIDRRRAPELGGIHGAEVDRVRRIGPQAGKPELRRRPTPPEEQPRLRLRRSGVVGDERDEVDVRREADESGQRVVEGDFDAREVGRSIEIVRREGERGCGPRRVRGRFGHADTQRRRRVADGEDRPSRRRVHDALVVDRADLEGHVRNGGARRDREQHERVAPRRAGPALRIADGPGLRLVVEPDLERFDEPVRVGPGPVHFDEAREPLVLVEHIGEVSDAHGQLGFGRLVRVHIPGDPAIARGE